ncbi:MAG: hypothetical protein VYB37_05085, partial [Pseudomonadota bacterium]|nr:hypothetical protein [Pseudomonadota bacterium]
MKPLAKKVRKAEAGFNSGRYELTIHRQREFLLHDAACPAARRTLAVWSLRSAAVSDGILS